ncbi:hypothetical protein M408DRAFT_167335 [Serendipita vermifera MAFF 305830]|uniref:Uncharacterized protein n=1 Tax=Serendipita vermifera MAFF 305830 TaxID=933852 RepID=A0A0C2XER2_SERVB|nr:hypothetical protein M408DRAFT_167335 [Serendipita vermifera MAFF 305830]
MLLRGENKGRTVILVDAGWTKALLLTGEHPLSLLFQTTVVPGPDPPSLRTKHTLLSIATWVRQKDSPLSVFPNQQPQT